MYAGSLPAPRRAVDDRCVLASHAPAARGSRADRASPHPPILLPPCVPPLDHLPLDAPALALIGTSAARPLWSLLLAHPCRSVPAAQCPDSTSGLVYFRRSGSARRPTVIHRHLHAPPTPAARWPALGHTPASIVTSSGSLWTLPLDDSLRPSGVRDGRGNALLTARTCQAQHAKRTHVLLRLPRHLSGGGSQWNRSHSWPAWPFRRCRSRASWPTVHTCGTSSLR